MTPERADELLGEAHRVALCLDDPMAEARSRFYLGQTAHTTGDVEEGRRQLERSWPSTGDRLPVGGGLGPPRAGWAAMAAGQVDKAGAHFERALEDLPEGTEMPPGPCAGGSGDGGGLAGEADRAGGLAEEAVAGARGPASPRSWWWPWCGPARSPYSSGQAGRAPTLLEVVGILSDLGARRWVADALGRPRSSWRPRADQRRPPNCWAPPTPCGRSLQEPLVGLPALSARLAGCRDRVEATLGAGAIAGAALSPDRVVQALDLARSELAALPT